MKKSIILLISILLISLLSVFVSAGIALECQGTCKSNNDCSSLNANLGVLDQYLYRCESVSPLPEDKYGTDAYQVEVSKNALIKCCRLKVVSPPNEEQGCIESDNGLNKFVPGFVYIVNDPYRYEWQTPTPSKDFCSKISNQIYETSCEGSGRFLPCGEGYVCKDNLPIENQEAVNKFVEIYKKYVLDNAEKNYNGMREQENKNLIIWKKYLEELNEQGIRGEERINAENKKRSELGIIGFPWHDFEAYENWLITHEIPWMREYTSKAAACVPVAEETKSITPQQPEKEVGFFQKIGKIWDSIFGAEEQQLPKGDEWPLATQVNVPVKIAGEEGYYVGWTKVINVPSSSIKLISIKESACNQKELASDDIVEVHYVHNPDVLSQKVLRPLGAGGGYIEVPDDATAKPKENAQGKILTTKASPSLSASEFQKLWQGLCAKKETPDVNSPEFQKLWGGLCFAVPERDELVPQEHSGGRSSLAIAPRHYTAISYGFSVHSPSTAYKLLSAPEKDKGIILPPPPTTPPLSSQKILARDIVLLQLVQNPCEGLKSANGVVNVPGDRVRILQILPGSKSSMPSKEASLKKVDAPNLPESVPSKSAEPAIPSPSPTVPKPANDFLEVSSTGMDVNKYDCCIQCPKENSPLDVKSILKSEISCPSPFRDQRVTGACSSHDPEDIQALCGLKTEAKTNQPSPEFKIQTQNCCIRCGYGVTKTKYSAEGQSCNEGDLLVKDMPCTQITVTSSDKLCSEKTYPASENAGKDTLITSSEYWKRIG